MEQHPQKYATPPKWYSEKKKLKAKPYMLRAIPCESADPVKLRKYCCVFL